MYNYFQNVVGENIRQNLKSIKGTRNYLLEEIKQN